MKDQVTREHVALAERMADVSRALLRRHYRTRLAVEDKADMSPVTAADREVEAALRELIAGAFPAHGVIGEEYGATREDAEYVWVLDPIDGTQAFILGVPVFGTLIALTRRGRPVLGVIDHPVTGERLLGGLGWPARRDGAPVHVRACGSLAAAALCATTPEMFNPAEAAMFERLRARAKLVRYGTDCYAYGLLASGDADAVVESDLNPYDYAAAVAVIEAAGGICSDWEGRPLTLALGSERLVCCGDPALHEEILELLAGTRGEAAPA